MYLWLADVARSAGLQVLEFPGWQTRTYAGKQPPDLYGVIAHHTATGTNWTDESVRYLVAIQGNATTPAPLSHYGLSRSGRVDVLAAGWCNHGGAGAWKGVTTASRFIGIEAYNDGKGEAWPTAQLDAYDRLCAAILRKIGRSADWLCGHKEWALPPGRKVDPYGIDMDQMRARVTRLLEGGTMTPIVGPPQATQSQALNFVTAAVERREGAAFGPATLTEIVAAYWTVGAFEGIRPEVGLAQACKETGFFAFGGDVLPTQWNFAGIGATGGGVAGESWPTIQQGVQGHLRRLRMYAAGVGYLHDLTILRRPLPSSYWGSAPNVEDLGGKWAPSPTYGASIVEGYLKPLLATPGDSYPDLVGHWAEASARKVIAKGLMVGDGTNFFPDRPVTRGELAVVLDKAELT